MNNNYFIFTENDPRIDLERFHVCTWEFNNGTAIIEFGAEIKTPVHMQGDSIKLKMNIPWLTSKYKINDLYEKLKDSENSRFIFNDSVTGNQFLDDGQQKNGVIQHFSGRPSLCIMPISYEIDDKNKIIVITVNLKDFRNRQKPSPNNDTSLYFRFFIEPIIDQLSTRKIGINRTNIIYDIKVNEKRNWPESSQININNINLCKIKSCFSFNIVPNSFDLAFFDSSTLKTVRTLEFNSFKRYMGDRRVKKDELVVVFNKKNDADSYAFFSSYKKERIGSGHFALAILANLMCGILLFIPTIRGNKSFFSRELWSNLPIEAILSISIASAIALYFAWPKIALLYKMAVIGFRKDNR
jgi:hypothetical protein